jgi:mono/diheme cytochrome c family protein
MIRTISLSLIAVAVLGFVGFAIYAHEPEMEAVAATDRQQFDAETVAKGQVLAAAGYCATCHTAEGGAPYAGNYAMETGFGTVYSTNITPDPVSGIGAWSENAFLFPAFPYDHFTKMNEDDIGAVYAYIMTEIEPVRSEQKENELAFPLNQRFLQAGWKLLFADLGTYEAEAEQSPEWNRGAYLVEGITHCGACHTPRNAFGAEKKNEQFAGAAVDQWIAPALTAENASAIRWTAAEFSDYLKIGGTPNHGIAAGPMAPVVHAGLRQLSERDLDAIGVYLADKVGIPDDADATREILMASLAKGKPQKHYRRDQGERLYATACASCHYNVEQIVLGRPDLGINSSTRLDEPDNLLHVILDGVGNEEGIDGVVMPAFRDALNDEEIAAIAEYLRTSRTDKSAWVDLSGKVAQIRAEHTARQ